MNIIEFLEARLNEDEVSALRAGTQHPAGPNWEPLHDRYVYGKCVAGTGQHRYQVEHMCRYDPARVLAECKAKRRIIAGWEDPATSQTYGSEVDDGYVLATDRAVRAIAAVYKDHPDYQEEWAV